MTERSAPLDEAGVTAARPVRAWCYLVWLSWQQQARARQMVWIAIGLLAITTTVVALITAADRWAPPYPFIPSVPPRPLNGKQGPIMVPEIPAAAIEEWRSQIAFLRYSRSIVFEVLLGFLLPIWCLSFATQALGSEREERNLVWLLTRPLARPGIYLAKFLALLPWSLALSLGGFGLLCLAAGRPGPLAFRLYWPAIVWGTLAYCALFHLMGTYFRRPAVVAIVYTFFVETFVGSMPGHMKRISISFYTRCFMFDVAGKYQLQPPQDPALYLPVSGATASGVLLAATVLLLALGVVVFSRMEYQDLT